LQRAEEDEPEDTQKILEQYHLYSSLWKIPDLVRCGKCGYSASLRGAEAKRNYFACPECEKNCASAPCMNCGKPHGPPKIRNCAEFEADEERKKPQEEVQRIKDLIAKETKSCPKCGKSFSKEDGTCQHMKCPGCGHAFWWCCLMEYKLKANEKGNMVTDKFSHSPKCPNNGHLYLKSDRAA
jgi:hypothetical protein